MLGRQGQRIRYNRRRRSRQGCRRSREGCRQGAGETGAGKSMMDVWIGNILAAAREGSNRKG